MVNKDEVMRLCITGKAVDDLKAMLLEIKEMPGATLSLSELAGFAIESFYQSGYSQHKTTMAKRFTSVKKLLRETASGNKTDAEILSILSSILKAKKKEIQSENNTEENKSSS